MLLEKLLFSSFVSCTTGKIEDNEQLLGKEEMGRDVSFKEDFISLFELL
jgi:hypothetical protein